MLSGGNLFKEPYGRLIDLSELAMTNSPTATVIKNPTWWRRRTQLERGLVALASVCLSLCIILVVVLTLTAYKQRYTPGEQSKEKEEQVAGGGDRLVLAGGGGGGEVEAVEAAGRGGGGAAVLEVGAEAAGRVRRAEVWEGAAAVVLEAGAGEVETRVYAGGEEVARRRARLVAFHRGRLAWAGGGALDLRETDGRISRFRLPEGKPTGLWLTSGAVYLKTEGGRTAYHSLRGGGGGGGAWKLLAEVEPSPFGPKRFLEFGGDSSFGFLWSVVREERVSYASYRVFRDSSAEPELFEVAEGRADYFRSCLAGEAVVALTEEERVLRVGGARAALGADILGIEEALGRFLLVATSADTRVVDASTGRLLYALPPPATSPSASTPGWFVCDRYAARLDTASDRLLLLDFTVGPREPPRSSSPPTTGDGRDNSFTTARPPLLVEDEPEEESDVTSDPTPATTTTDSPCLQLCLARLNNQFLFVLLIPNPVLSLTFDPPLDPDRLESIFKDESLPTMSALDAEEPLSAAAAAAGAGGGGGGGARRSEKGGVGDVCLTEGCVHTASSLLKSMDQEVEPCDDFYQFACGQFRKKHIPDDKSSISTFSIINDDLQDQLRTIVDSPAAEGEPKPFAYAKNLYSACMDKKRIECVGGERVKGMLREVGGWPVLEGDSWDEGAFSWKQSVYNFRRVGFSVDYFIDFSVGTDLKNSTTRIIDLDQASLGLSREYLVKGLSQKLVAAYYAYMVDVAVLFGADKERAKRELKDSLEFEMKLANISLAIEERRNASKLYNPMTLDEMQSRFPSVPWREYLGRILPAEVPLKKDEVVVVSVPQFITQLEQLLAHTPKRIQANYAMWRAAASTVSYLSEAFRDRQLIYATAITGRTEKEARWKECVDIASSSLGLAVGSLYVRRFFKEDAKKSALEIMEGIRHEMYKILESVEWMDQETRRSALEKAKSMTAHIAYPDELLDDDKLVHFYRNLEVSNGSYFEAILNLTKFGTEYSFGRLREPVNKTEWVSHGRPAVVNAYYSSIENSIQFPAGILQGSFFSNERPRYMNYGAIGFVIGHEITHGFDDQGRQFDKDGNLVDWWAPETRERYLEKAQCIIYQYGNYSDSQVNMKLNGINTQGENIADNGGIKQAYRAYRSWVRENGAEPRLPGLQRFTGAQMFWISAASTWCSVYRDESLSNRITTGFHSPGEFRVIGPFSNMAEFSEDFCCPKGSKMNPVHKCNVW